MKHPYKLGDYIVTAKANTKPLPENVKKAVDNSIQCFERKDCFSSFQHFHSKAFHLMRKATGLDLAFYLNVPRCD